MRRALLLAILIAVSGCSSVPAGLFNAIDPPGPGPHVSMHYLGNGGWIFQRGNDVIATAPFVSQPRWYSFLFPGHPKERLIEEVIKRLNVGNLMVLVQIGSMPHELTLKNIDLFAREVLPGLREIWDDKGWENHWWPKSLRGSRQPAGAAR